MATGHPGFVHHFGHVLDKELAWRDETRNGIQLSPARFRGDRLRFAGPPGVGLAQALG